jgi:thiamine pyrophosphokinase
VSSKLYINKGNYLFEDIKKASDILDGKKQTKEKNLFLVHFDRASRVFLYGLLFHMIRKFKGINIYTLIDEQNTFELLNKNILEDDNMKQTLWIFQLILFNSQAEKHSEDLSNKIKNRVSKDKGVTISNKTGKRWGAESTISQTMKRRIKNKSKKYSPKEIQEQADVYQIKKGKKIPISIHSIYKILQE